ncbi:MAG: hypothetical protein V4590_14465 [Bacteroidota bacterium]
MKKLVSYFLILLFASTLFAATPSHNEVRALYKKAAIEEASCKKLVALLHSYNEENNTLLAGYRACATMLMAKHVLNPFRKLSHFTEGRQLLEKSIDTDKNNVELRFLRFTIQTNAPSFLHYNNDILRDKLFLLNTISTLQDTKLKQLITDYLNTSPYLTSIEKTQLINE